MNVANLQYEIHLNCLLRPQLIGIRGVTRIPLPTKFRVGVVNAKCFVLDRFDQFVIKLELVRFVSENSGAGYQRQVGLLGDRTACTIGTFVRGLVPQKSVGRVFPLLRIVRSIACLLYDKSVFGRGTLAVLVQNDSIVGDYTWVDDLFGANATGCVSCVTSVSELVPVQLTGTAIAFIPVTCQTIRILPITLILAAVGVHRSSMQLPFTTKLGGCCRRDRQCQ